MFITLVDQETIEGPYDSCVTQDTFAFDEPPVGACEVKNRVTACDIDTFLGKVVLKTL